MEKITPHLRFVAMGQKTRGRKPKSEEDKRQHRVVFRLTNAELNALRQKAEDALMTPTEFARQAALGRSVQKKWWAEIRRDLARIGNNLNQMAKKANTEGAHVLNAASLSDGLKELAEVLNQVRDRGR